MTWDVDKNTEVNSVETRYSILAYDANQDVMFDADLQLWDLKNGKLIGKLTLPNLQEAEESESDLAGKIVLASAIVAILGFLLYWLASKIFGW